MVVGGSGLHARIVEGGLELGYWIRVSQTRRGYATEVARALTTAGFEVPGVVRVEVHCDPRNLFSRRIPERLGYRLVETRRADRLTPAGEPRDTAVFEMTRERWEDLRHSGGAGEAN
jgi:RimJ/RimL family protein N-acetyltransferase